MAKRRRERTVYDGIEPDENLSPRVVNISASLIRAWERDLAKVDDKIARLVRCRAARIRNIADAREKLRKS